MGAELFTADLKVLIKDGTRRPGTYDTYRYHLDKNVLPRIGELVFVEVTTPRVNKVIIAIRNEVGVGSAKTCTSIISGILARLSERVR
jgi:hypothetical protein